jgi:hypothetical protein
MKILNKENIKWWGKNKLETWAFKKNGDWWITKPEKEVKPFSSLKNVSEDKPSWRAILISSLAGGLIGLIVFCLLVTYLFLRDAI